jgi:ubiquinone/menaquinone biosynthesis C-methylase UbiE
LTVYEHRDKSDAKKLVKLILENVQLSPKSFILDVACGAGRHAVHFSKLDFRVFGIDLSNILLKQAQKHCCPPYFVQSDMRYLPFSKKFDLVFSLFTSFGYFESDRTNREVALEMSRVLKQNGDLIIDYLNPEYVIKNLVPEGKRKIGDIIICEKRWIADQRVHKKIHLKQNGKDKVYFESVRLYNLDEMTSILNNAGIHVVQVHGEYTGKAFKPSSSRMIIFGKKK